MATARDADDLPDPDSADARRAVIRAARTETTVISGAFIAKRTWVESTDAWGDFDARPVVRLSYRDDLGGDVIAMYRVRRFNEVRDWTHPEPDGYERGDTVLPASRYGIQDIFPDTAVLPGGDD